MFSLNSYFKRNTKVEKSVDLNHQRIFILPTKQGGGFLVSIIILFLISFVYNNNLSYLLTFLLISVFLISLLHSYQSLYGLKLSFLGCHKVFAGEALGVNLLLSNPMNLERINLQVGFSADEKINLQAHEEKKLTLPFFVNKRGWQEMEKITVSSTYPFGFFRVWSVIHFSEKYLAYPAPTIDDSSIPFTGNESNLGEDIVNTTHLSKGDDFNGLKEYRGGDPIKHIHWKSFAKGHGLFTKQFQLGSKSNQHLWLDFDLTTGHDLEKRLSQLCRWVVDAEKSGQDYGFLLPGYSIQPSHGDLHYHQCLKALALFNP